MSTDSPDLRLRPLPGDATRRSGDRRSRRPRRPGRLLQPLPAGMPLTSRTKTARRATAADRRRRSRRRPPRSRAARGRSTRMEDRTRRAEPPRDTFVRQSPSGAMPLDRTDDPSADDEGANVARRHGRWRAGRRRRCRSVPAARRRETRRQGSVTRTMPCPIEPKIGLMIDVAHLADGGDRVGRALADDGFWRREPGFLSSSAVV